MDADVICVLPTTRTELPECQPLPPSGWCGHRYRKIPQVMQEMFGITLSPAALIGFEKQLCELAQPVVDDIAKKIASSDGAVHADETYSVLDGRRSYFWVHGTTRYID